MVATNWAAIAFILATVGICCFMLFVPRKLGGASKGSAKHETYESGIVSAGDTKIRLSANFYLIAIFFVIFDLEALFLYVYAVSVKEAGWYGFYTALIFAAILLIGLLYELSLGTLNWSPENKYKVKGIYNKKTFNLSEITAYTTFEDLASDKTGKIPTFLREKNNNNEDNS